LAAALFGLSAPVAKVLLADMQPLMLAGLFYVGSGGCITIYRLLRPANAEAKLRSMDVPALAGLALLGGMMGPVLMLWGLSRVGALTGSLLLNLEAPFTMLVAVLLFREHMGKRAVAAAACILGGALVLKLRPAGTDTDAWGILAIAAACLCWAFDNNLTQRLTTRDPFAVVRTKALVAGTANLALAYVAGQPPPPATVLAAALLVGALSYGASVVLDAYALRHIGAAREAAYFATAPFMGALGAVFIVGEPLRAWDVASLLLMIAGVFMLIRERHAHAHEHAAMTHEHIHVHDEHHQHNHALGVSRVEPHSHEHYHARLVHDHPHVPDLHHRHRHRS
jgi:drug/metabolite transporter (DMT)-like permease